LTAGVACLGPLAVGGCHARCPTLGGPCIGCRGPVEDANVASGLETLAARGLDAGVARLKLGTFLPSFMLPPETPGGEM